MAIKERDYFIYFFVIACIINCIICKYKIRLLKSRQKCATEKNKLACLLSAWRKPASNPSFTAVEKRWLWLTQLHN